MKISKRVLLGQVALLASLLLVARLVLREDGSRTSLAVPTPASTEPSPNAPPREIQVGERAALTPLALATDSIAGTEASDPAAAVSANEVWWGRVTAGGHPLAGARVRLTRDISELRPDFEDERLDHGAATSDADGLVRFEVPRNERWDLRVSAKTAGLVELGLELGHDAPAQAQPIELKAGAALVAELVDARGAPVVDVEVHLATPGWESSTTQVDAGSMRHLEWTATSGADGRALFALVPAELALDVEVWDGRQALLRRANALVLRAGEEGAVRWIVGGQGAIDGRVTDEHGLPIPNVMLLVLAASDEPQPDRSLSTRAINRVRAAASGSADEEGRFELGPLAFGAYQLVVVDDSIDRPPVQPEARIPHAARWLELTPDAPRAVADFALPRGLYVTGRVVDASGAGRPDVYVDAYDEERGGDRVQTDATGGFTIGPLLAGLYSVAARAPEGSFQAQSSLAEAGGAPVRITLHTGGTITGRLLAARGAPTPSEYLLSVRSEDAPAVPRGSDSAFEERPFRVAGLEDGVYVLFARTADGRIGFRHGVFVRRGETTENADVTVEAALEVRMRYEGPAASARMKVIQDGVPVMFIELPRGESHAFSARPGAARFEVEPQGGQPFTELRDLRPEPTVEVVLRES